MPKADVSSGLAQCAVPTGTTNAQRLACPVEQIVGQILTPETDMVLS